MKGYRGSDRNSAGVVQAGDPLRLRQGQPALGAEATVRGVECRDLVGTGGGHVLIVARYNT